MKDSSLLASKKRSSVEVENYIFKSPKLRYSAIGNPSNAMITEKNKQYSWSGLKIKGGRSSSSNELGYAYEPWIHKKLQVRTSLKNG